MRATLLPIMLWLSGASVQAADLTGETLLAEARAAVADIDTAALQTLIANDPRITCRQQ
jgi:hypothetical protein